MVWVLTIDDFLYIIIISINHVVDFFYIYARFIFLKGITIFIKNDIFNQPIFDHVNSTDKSMR